MCMSKVIPQIWEKKGFISKSADGSSYESSKGPMGKLFAGLATKNDPEMRRLRREREMAAASGTAVQRMPASGAQRSLLG